jgi:hypothetical protein
VERINCAGEYVGCTLTIGVLSHSVLGGAMSAVREGRMMAKVLEGE